MPKIPMLNQIHSPADLQALPPSALPALADEIRAEIIRVVAERGGHLASNLGIVELTIALHYVFHCPTDSILFDVGHQSYTHKILTGRYEAFQRLRMRGGVSGFPRSDESECDAFDTGHASTAISVALGLARARDMRGEKHHVVAVVGDGALTGGMCYEALNDAGQSKTRMIVILNDNEMSISRNVGALATYLQKLRQNSTYMNCKQRVQRTLERMPLLGGPLTRAITRLRDSLKALVIGDQFFDALGFDYIGPVNGHDVRRLIVELERVKQSNRPVVLHVITQKGHGYRPAEQAPTAFHGAMPFLIETGEPRHPDGLSNGERLAQDLVQMAQADPRIVVVTAAMGSGTGMEAFERAFPERYFDVGIAEAHAITMAAGMAKGGLKPYAAIYSTFLQRAYDQLMMDVCENDLPVTMLIDRAGLVGSDGSTHQGAFDIGFLRQMPNMIVSAPCDIEELRGLLRLSAQITDHPMAIRYAKGGLTSSGRSDAFEIGTWAWVRPGTDIVVLAIGPMVAIANRVAEKLAANGMKIGVVSARFIKPLDESLLFALVEAGVTLITLEDHARTGGLGAAVAEALAARASYVPLTMLGIPDAFIACGTYAEQLADCGLDEASVMQVVEAKWKERYGKDSSCG